MAALKLLVVAMGVLLVGGVVVLAIAVADRANHPRPTTSAAATNRPLASTLDLPAGAHVVGAEASGDRLVVRVDLGGGGEELIVVNLATGAPISTVTLRPQIGSP